MDRLLCKNGGRSGFVRRIPSSSLTKQALHREVSPSFSMGFPFLKRSVPNRGSATIEIALLVPLMMGTLLGIVQIVIYLQSAIAAQYGAYMAARSFQVYGDRSLREIGYPHVLEPPNTHADQTIGEAAAERIIFESLLWEHRRIQVQSDGFSRTYQDGGDVAYNGVERNPSTGVVRVNYISRSKKSRLEGVELTYCVPIVFPGLQGFFSLIQKRSPCSVSRTGEHYRGIALVEEVGLGREPSKP